MDENKLKDVIGLLSEICNDSTTPKNVKERMIGLTNILNNSDDVSIKINKALYELDEITNDNNMQQFTRTQLWNVASLLEKI